MVTERGLIDEVDAAFATTGQGLPGWIDPHPHRQPSDEDYSRVSDPDKWRIVGARADAWLLALVETGLAAVDPNADIHWRLPPKTVLSRSERVTPYVATALPLIVARSRVGGIDDAGVTLGVGDPAVCVAWIPDCGCDACDSGSQDVLDELDSHILGVVSGESRRLWQSGDREIIVVGDGDVMQTTGIFNDGEVQSILANPSSWLDYSGAAWFTER